MHKEQAIRRWLFLICSGLLYIFIAYFIERHESVALLGAYTLLFGFYAILLKHEYNAQNLKTVILMAVGLRILLLPAFPNLSDDIFRFVWDGRLINAGINPFAQLPSYYLQPGHAVNGLNLELYQLLNSPEYFTIYPPFAQFVFWFSTAFTSSVWVSAVVIRTLIIVAEIVSIFIGLKLLRKLKLPDSNILLYALNPLVILEFTGNLHFEAFLICFLILAIYYLHQQKWLKAGLFMALSIAAKLIPLMLLPMFIKRLSVRQLFKYYGFIAVFLALFFLPLFNLQFIQGMQNSIGLYFQKFEFNASIYYLVREVGYWAKGYNIIGTAGKYLAAIAFMGILTISFIHKKGLLVFYPIAWVLTLYWLFSTTIHPWYIGTLVMITVFTTYRYAVIWSFLIGFTYAGYTIDGFVEPMNLVIIEYLVVVIFAGYEFYKHYKKSLQPTKIH